MTGIISGFFKGIKSIGEETVEKAVDNTGKIASGIITGEQLFGIKKQPMSMEQEQRAKQEDEMKKRQEEEKIKQEFMGQGRNVEQEIEQVRKEKERKEEEEEKFLLNLERQRMAEAREREQMNAGVPSNSKKEAAKHQGQRGHKAHAPDPASMSATGEMTGGKID